MIKGILKKYESTNEGITVTIQCDHTEATPITLLWRKEVVIASSEGEFPVDNLREALKLQAKKFLEILEG